MLPTYMRQGNVVIEGPVTIPIPRSTALATFAPYRGEEIAQLNNMSPFTKGQYVPAVVGNWSGPVYKKVNRNSSYAGGYGGAPFPNDPILGLKYGDKGSAVGALQVLLQMLIPGALSTYGADEDYGNETVTWVKKFQKGGGLSQTGKIDQPTYNLLKQEWDKAQGNVAGVKKTESKSEASGDPWYTSLAEAFGKGLGQGVVTPPQTDLLPTQQGFSPSLAPSSAASPTWLAPVLVGVGLLGAVAFIAFVARDKDEGPLQDADTFYKEQVGRLK